MHPQSMGLKLSPDLPPLDSTDSTPFAEKTIHARLFALGSPSTCLIAEYDPEDKVAFGYADLFGGGQDAEWGYVSIEELESLKFMGIPRVEVDAHFTPRPFAECVRPDGTII